MKCSIKICCIYLLRLVGYDWLILVVWVGCFDVLVWLNYVEILRMIIDIMIRLNLVLFWLDFIMFFFYCCFFIE